MQNKGVTILSLIVLLFGVFYYSAQTLISDKAWFRCTAFEHLLQGILSYAVARKVKGDTVWLLAFTQIGVLLMFSNYLDEIFFNPTRLQWNEIIFGLMAIIIPIAKNAREIHKTIHRDR